MVQQWRQGQGKMRRLVLKRLQQGRHWRRLPKQARSSLGQLQERQRRVALVPQRLEQHSQLTLQLRTGAHQDCQMQSLQEMAHKDGHRANQVYGIEDINAKSQTSTMVIADCSHCMARNLAKGGLLKLACRLRR